MANKRQTGAIVVRHGARGTRYQVKVRGRDGLWITETHPDRKTAAAALHRLKSDIEDGRIAPMQAARKRTLAELIDRYISDIIPQKKGWARLQGSQLERWRMELGHLTVADVTPAAVAQARDRIAKDRITVGQGKGQGHTRSPASTNRYLAALSHAFTIAVKEWQWASDNPVTKTTKKREPRGRVRMLSEAEQQKLLSACRELGPDYLAPIVIIALATGMRRGEILAIRWPSVDLKAGRLTVEDSKNGERRGVSLAGPALATLKARSKVRAIDDDRVFPDVKSLTWAFTRALKKAKILDFRFHDLRHTAASYLAMNGANASEIARALGHRQISMAHRYAHLHDEHMAGVMSRMADRFLSGIDNE